MAIDALRCPPERLPTSPSLSGGEKRRIALARLLLSASPTCMLLDEPTNHLDAESVAWLQHHLENFPGCVILVTHDRYFLDLRSPSGPWNSTAARAIPLRGQLLLVAGSRRQKRVVQEQSESESRQRALTRELEWVRSSAPRPVSPSRRPVWPAYERNGRRAGERCAPPRPTPTSRYRPGPRLGNLVLEVEGLEKDLRRQGAVRQDLSFKPAAERHRRRDRPERRRQVDPVQADHRPAKQPDGGTIKVGETVKLAYVDQSRDDLKPDETIWQAISGGTDVMMVGKREINTRAYVGSFNFKGGDQQKKVGQLSGGERNRVHLAKTLASGGNLILLDEPTNDLDIETLQNLEEALEEFAGCAVVISHDRWFLDRLATHILAFEGDGHVEWFEGNFEAYEQDKMRRLGADSIIPKRIQHQKFGR